MMEMMVLVMEMMKMMITMKSSSMAVTISPSGKEFPRQISACRRAFLSVWFFHLAAAAEYFSGRSPVLRILGRMKYVKGCRQKWARAASPCLGAA